MRFAYVLFLAIYVLNSARLLLYITCFPFRFTLVFYEIFLSFPSVIFELITHNINGKGELKYSTVQDSGKKYG